MDQGNCAACSRTIDLSARMCPFCGSDPRTGQKIIDTQALLQEVFQPRDISASESVIEYAKQRQGAVIAIGAFVGFLIIAALHQYVTMRNENAVTDAPAVPLSEVTDVARKADEAAPVPMPKLDFQYEGRPEAMQTFIVEPGAVPPPEVAAAQAAAAPPAQPQAPATPQRQPLPPRRSVLPQPR